MYLDVFFFVNFIMDYLIIHITMFFLDEVSRIWRKVLAAFTGSLWAVIEVVMTVKNPDLKLMLSIITYLFIATLMIVIAIGTVKLKRVLRGTLIMYVVSFFTAGSCYAIYNYSATGYILSSNMLNYRQIMAGIVIALLVKYLMDAYLYVRKKYMDNIYQIKLVIQNQCVYFRGLCDTGNVLVDPYTGKIVHIVQKSVLDKILNKKVNDIKCRLVPYNSVGKNRGLLPVIDVDCMQVYKKDKLIFKDAAVIGIYKGNLSAKDNYDALINAGIFKYDE